MKTIQQVQAELDRVNVELEQAKKDYKNNPGSKTAMLNQERLIAIQATLEWFLSN